MCLSHLFSLHSFVPHASNTAFLPSLTILCQDCRSSVRSPQSREGPTDPEQTSPAPDPGCAINLGNQVAFSRHDKTTARSNLVWEREFTLLMVPETTQPTMAGGVAAGAEASLAVRKLSDPRGSRSGAKLYTSKRDSQHAPPPASLQLLKGL